VEKLSAVGQLAAFVSHEIRNPLVAIGGHARSLLQDPIHDPAMVESLKVIASEVGRLEKFLRETLDFVKPRVVGTTPVDLHEEVRQSIATFRKEISERGVDLEEALGEGPVFCVTDPELVRHAFSNLIKNALEAMEGGGKLHVGLERRGRIVTIRVGDTGVGIPPELRGRIFDPFFTTKPGGTGLGLSIASHSIRGVGGRLELEDDGRFKTMFRLVLPMEDGPAGGSRGAVGRSEEQELFAGRHS
jgi:two-component system sensor histidine kinase HydH